MQEHTEGAVKLNMHKAYDTIECVFFQLLKQSFHSNWIEMVMQCVTLVEYRIRLNSDVTESFKPSIGLRQGNPLSSYLFMLCTKDLTTLFSHGVHYCMHSYSC